MSTGLRQPAVRRTPSAGQPAAARFCHRHRHRLRRLASTTVAGGVCMDGRPPATAIFLPCSGGLWRCSRQRAAGAASTWPAIADVQPTRPRCPVPWTPLGSGPGGRGRQPSVSNVRPRMRPVDTGNRQAAGTVDTRGRGRARRHCGMGTRPRRQRPAGQPAAATVHCRVPVRPERERKLRHRPAPPWPDRQVRRLVLRVDLVGSRRIYLAQVGGASVQADREGTGRIVRMINGMIKHLDRPHCWGSGGEPTAIRILDLPITSRILGVDPDGSRRIQTGRLDDHRDDQSASDRKSDGKASGFRLITRDRGLWIRARVPRRRVEGR